MANQTLEQQRAAHANRYANRKGISDNAKKAPAMVQSNGLAQAVAFFVEKWGKDDDVLGALQDWILKKAEHLPIDRNKTNLLDAILACDSSTYRAVTAEALAYLGWLKRLAGAHEKEKSHA
ncbi:MAG: type III-B CRISPR module-associated protein Cmr5 [Planctomycetes bacterium]|nr:type III-B CRISPR module-associated protein Cmr5 [Planctomycetota bacterium]